MTNFGPTSIPDDEPEADVAEQWMPIDADDVPTLDVDHLVDRYDATANDADLVDQAIDIPLPEDDRR